MIVQEKLTGTTKKRPEFQDLLTQLEIGDTLIVTKLDRFARNTNLDKLAENEPIPEHLIAHISPICWEHINFFGDFLPSVLFLSQRS